MNKLQSYRDDYTSSKRNNYGGIQIFDAHNRATGAMDDSILYQM